MADPLIIKICGIKTSEILETVIASGADMVGFMHFPRSPRHVSIEEIATLISEARGRIQTCVVLVNPDNSCVAEVAALGPDWIQLHGPETPHRVEAIRAEAGVEIMKALPIGTAEDVAHVADRPYAVLRLERAVEHRQVLVAQTGRALDRSRRVDVGDDRVDLR